MKKTGIFLLLCSSVFATPKEGNVVAGKARFSQKDRELCIMTSESAIIEWKSFDQGINR